MCGSARVLCRQIQQLQLEERGGEGEREGRVNGRERRNLSTVCPLYKHGEGDQVLFEVSYTCMSGYLSIEEGVDTPL